jgi:GNAT superfamily N-acetyltransferase
MAADYVIRQLTAQDEAVLWDALYQGVQAAAPADAPPPPEIVRQPDLARYVDGWGAPGDRGFIAHEAETGQVLGVVWFREPAAGVTPELAFVVAPGQRKRGIGAALLTQWVRTNPEQSEIALRVHAAHPAVRLYERFGFRVAGERDGFVTLRRDAPAAA